MSTVWGDTLVYNTIGQHKNICFYAFSKLSIYTVIPYANMVFQGQVIMHTIKNYVKYPFDNKTQVNLIWTHSLVVVNWYVMTGILYVLWMKSRKLDLHIVLNTL